MSRESKTLSFQVKATGTTVNAKGQEVGEIEAYGAVFDNVDEGGDRILQGAFTRTIKNSKARAKARDKEYILPILWQHDDHELMGSWYDLKEDQYGLLCKGHVLLATQRGREYYELAKAGMSDLFSIIYDTPEGGVEWVKKGITDGHRRDLKELRLYSADPVTFAMNEETMLVGVKAKKDTKPMDKKPIDKKTLLEHYQEEMAEDLLEDWQDVYVCALTCAVMDALKIGDTLASDISDALDAFKELVMSKFVTQALDVDVSGYLEDNTYSSTPADYTMQYGSESRPDSGYGWMSRHTNRLLRKAGRAISASNTDAIQGHVDALHDMADDHMAAAKKQSKAMHAAADTLASILPDADTTDGKQDGKSRGTSPQARSDQSRSSDEDTVSEEEIAAALADVRMYQKLLSSK